MQKDYNLSNWIRSPGGKYFLTANIADPSNVSWIRDPNGAYHINGDNNSGGGGGSGDFSYTFNVGPISELPYDKKPNVTIENTDNTITFDFSFPRAANAYQVAVENGYTDTVENWLSSLKGSQGQQGIQGVQGLQGPAGLGLTNKGNWVSGTTYERGDYVFAQTSKNDGGYAMFVVLSENSFTSTIEPDSDATNWEQIYAPQGPQGPQGIQGQNGTDGLSAYEISVQNGYTGTEEQWLSSLQGNSVSSVSLNITKS